MRRAPCAVVATVIRALLCIVLAAGLAPAALAFDNTEPDAAQQWYLTQDNAWSFWPTQPTLAPVKVAVIDSGIDATHPEFAGPGRRRHLVRRRHVAERHLRPRHLRRRRDRGQPGRTGSASPGSRSTPSC